MYPYKERIAVAGIKSSKQLERSMWNALGSQNIYSNIKDAAVTYYYAAHITTTTQA